MKKDFACVNQDQPQAGVSALPMILAQCNAVISLTDDEYYTRAWCSVEVMVAQTLARSYGLHIWYEHFYDTPSHHSGLGHNSSGQVDRDEGNDGKEGDWGDDTTKGKGSLRNGPLEMEIIMADKLLSFERDRPKVLFLERQSRLLG